jgi:hypothetical protein
MSQWSQADANGFYWWRYDRNDNPQPVEVRDQMFYSVVDPDPTTVSVGEFFGPITPADSGEEAIRLREALEALVRRVEKMMENGPECDCPAEGHMCGWPALQQEVKAARAALQPKAEPGDSA